MHALLVRDGRVRATAVVDGFVALVERAPELFGTDPATGELVPA